LQGVDQLLLGDEDAGLLPFDGDESQGTSGTAIWEVISLIE
jgi:hypothetical protein